MQAKPDSELEAKRSQRPRESVVMRRTKHSTKNLYPFVVLDVTKNEKYKLT